MTPVRIAAAIASAAAGAWTVLSFLERRDVGVAAGDASGETDRVSG
jgi:hypothetical protein